MSASPQTGTRSHVVLETERLILRYLTADDVEAMFAVIGDAEAMKYYPQPLTRDDAQRWIDRSLERYRTDGYGLFAVVLKSTGEVIGNCGLRAAGSGRRVDAGSGISLSSRPLGQRLRDRSGARLHGIRLSPTRRGKKLISLIVPENVPSRRVAERNGMQAERQVMFHERPHLMYSVTREDYGQA